MPPHLHDPLAFLTVEGESTVTCFQHLPVHSALPDGSHINLSSLLSTGPQQGEKAEGGPHLQAGGA